MVMVEDTIAAYLGGPSGPSWLAWFKRRQLTSTVLHSPN